VAYPLTLLRYEVGYHPVTDRQEAKPGDEGKETKPKRSRSRNYSRNLGAGERPTFYAPPKLIDEVDKQREVDSDSKSALIAKLLSVCLESQGGRELRSVASANRRTLVSELENFLAAPLDLPFYDKLLEAASAEARDRTQMLMYLVRLGWDEYQKRQRQAGSDSNSP
jgi:hypothetical protein